MVSMQDKSSVKEQYGGSEMLSILIPSADGLQLLNGAVESFCFAVVPTSPESIEDSRGVAGKHIEDLVDLWYMRFGGLDEPHGVEREGLLAVCRAYNVPEVLFDSPCTRHLVVSLGDGVELHLLSVCETGSVFEEEILGVLQLVLRLHLSNSRLVNGFVQVLYEMIWVVAYLCIGEQLLGNVDECLPHIHRDSLDRSPLDGSQVLLYQLLGILLGTSLYNVDYKACVTITENGHILALAPCLLVDTQMTVYLDLAPDTQAKLHTALHYVAHLVGCEPQKAGRSDLALRLEQCVYRFFSSRSVMRSPASAQGTCTLAYFPSGNLQRGMRALMNVLYCHMSRCLQTRSGRKSYMGKCLPAITMSGLQYSTSTYMLSFGSSEWTSLILQSLPRGSRRDASISSVLFAIRLQRYEEYLMCTHTQLLNVLTNGIVNSH
mgnify:CR=1 FL=1